MEDVTQYIPHRPPFLFVDEIVELTDDRIMARKKMDPAESFFKGHYPGTPIVPGVLLCEAIFQSGAILISKLMRERKNYDMLEGVPVLTRIKSAKFKRMVKPGDTIEIESSVTETVSNVYYMKGKASVDGKTSVVVEYACCLVEKEEA